jgi:hypothetical protein
VSIDGDAVLVANGGVNLMHVCGKLRATIVALALAWPVAALPAELPELVEHMASLQYLVHKAGLAIDQQNQPLADFYAHELEERIERVVKVGEYHGYPIGTLATTRLVPAFEDFAHSLASARDWPGISSRLDRMIEACNSCHQATDHGFINVVRTTANPFSQTFAPIKGPFPAGD